MKFILKEVFTALAEFAALVGLVSAIIWMFLL